MRDLRKKLEELFDAYEESEMSFFVLDRDQVISWKADKLNYLLDNDKKINDRILEREMTQASVVDKCLYVLENVEDYFDGHTGIDKVFKLDEGLHKLFESLVSINDADRALIEEGEEMLKTLMEEDDDDG